MQAIRRKIALVLLWAALWIGGDGFTDYALETLLGIDEDEWE